MKIYIKKKAPLSALRGAFFYGLGRSSFEVSVTSLPGPRVVDDQRLRIALLIQVT